MNTEPFNAEVVSSVAMKAYAAYGDFVGWKNFAGQPMPKWEELPEKIRGAWMVATLHVIDWVKESKSEGTPWSA